MSPSERKKTNCMPRQITTNSMQQKKK
jgi:hypothetical protein